MPERVKEDTHYCFGCGERNPIGLKLRFQWEGELLTGVFTPQEEHQGYPGMTHGGIIATLLDEVMANALFSKGIFVVTAEMNVRYIHKVPTGKELRLCSRLVNHQKRLYEVEGWIEDDAGKVLARGFAKMLSISPKKTS